MENKSSEAATDKYVGHSVGMSGMKKGANSAYKHFILDKLLIN